MHSPNTVLHPWFEHELTAIIAALPLLDRVPDAATDHATWTRWQEGLSARFTLLETLPPLRVLLILDNLAGHKSAAFVCWLMAHGIMPTVHAIERSLAEHGGIRPTDFGESGLGRTTPREPDPID